MKIKKGYIEITDGEFMFFMLFLLLLVVPIIIIGLAIYFHW